LLCLSLLACVIGFFILLKRCWSLERSDKKFDIFNIFKYLEDFMLIIYQTTGKYINFWFNMKKCFRKPAKNIWVFVSFLVGLHV